jgi:hypothetical protein
MTLEEFIPNYWTQLYTNGPTYQKQLAHGILYAKQIERLTQYKLIATEPSWETGELQPSFLFNDETGYYLLDGLVATLSGIYNSEN